MTNLNFLEGTVNHGDEHVEQHYHHGNVVNPVQHVTSVLDEFVPVIDDDRSDLGQSKYGPEQRLEALLQSAHRQGNKETWAKLFWNSKQTINHYKGDVKDTQRKATEGKIVEFFLGFC